MIAKGACCEERRAVAARCSAVPGRVIALFLNKLSCSFFSSDTKCDTSEFYARFTCGVSPLLPAQAVLASYPIRLPTAFGNGNPCVSSEKGKEPALLSV